MTGGGLSCPMEECDENRGGYCNIRQEGPLGWAAAAFYMPGTTNFMAPFGPAVGMMPTGNTAEGMPPMSDAWGMWRNCPRRKAREQKR